MKKRDFILAGALLLGFGLNAHAQTEEETLFFYGFEDNLASFRDSSKAVDSITEIRYYDGVISNGAGAGVYPQDLTIAYVKDSLMPLLHGLSPYRSSSRQDSYELIRDELGGHQADLESMGAQGGEYYFKYTSGGEGESLCNDYEANLFVRGLKLEDNTSYRIVFYSKASDPTANMQAGVFRGYYNSERAISMNGDSGNEFLLDKTSFTTDKWERNTIMMYYQNDSVANRHMYYSGFWWQDSWRTKDPETGTEYNAIEQFDTYFLRFSFRYPARVYYLDDIALYKSTIGGAEYNGEILRVNFGYDTNLGALARSKAEGAIELPGEYFTLTAEYGGDPWELNVLSAEYHSDGYLYIWLDDDSFEGLENVRLSFTNPDDPALQLKYTGTLYPNSLDQAWVDAGKIVPDFENEFAVYNPEVFATSLKYYPPAVVSVSPEEGSFGLSGTTNKVDVTFSKEVYANLSKPLDDESSVLLRLQTENGVENWVPVAYDEETFTVTFQRPSSNSGELKGDYDFTVLNAHADRGAQYMRGDDYNFSYSFGPADIAPVYMGKSDFTAYNDGANEVEGFSVNDYGMMRVRQFSGIAGKALMFGLYGQNLQNDPKSDDPTRGPALSYKVNVSETGEWRVSWATSGCLKNSWNDGALMWFRIYDSAENIIYEANMGEDHVNLPEEGGVVTSYQTFQEMIEFPNTGEYTLVWNLPNENSYSGGHQGGRVLYYVEVSNEYSSAYKYIETLLSAQASAKSLLESAKADQKYSGDYLNDFQNVIDSYEGFTSTAPSAYNNAVKALSDASAEMSGRMSVVDKYYTEYAAAEAKANDSVNAKTSYSELEAYKALVAKIAEYKDLDVTKEDNESLTAITAEVTAATKAMTDRCDAIDKFNSTIENAKSTYDKNELLQDLDALVALNRAYEQYKGIDRIASADEDLKAATDAVQAAIDEANNAVTTYTETTAQIKKLYGLATDLEAPLSDDVKTLYANTISDDQNLAKLLKLEINKALYQMLSEDIEIPEGGIDYTGFITNPGLYMVGTLDNQIEQYWYSYSSRNNWRVKAGNEYVDEVFPGWSIKSTGSVHAAYGINGIDGGGYAAPGYAKAGGIAADWSSSFTLKQTVTDLPNGVYTLSVNFGAGENNKEKQHVLANGDTLAVASDQGAVNNTWENIIVTDGVLDLTAVHTGCNAWSRLDDWSLTLISVDPIDYAAEIAKIDGEIAEVETTVAPVESAADVKYYNLSGVRTAQPEGISIRVTTGKNGARKVEKVLVK